VQLAGPRADDQALDFDRTTAMLKIQRTTDGTAVVLTVSGRLDAENVGQLCESLDAIGLDTTVALDLRDLVLADRAVVRLLREFEEGKRIVLRNCPEYIRIWMTAEDAD
jgi:anti-anti-sigma regulatory factor